MKFCMPCVFLAFFSLCLQAQSEKMSIAVVGKSSVNCYDIDQGIVAAFEAEFTNNQRFVTINRNAFDAVLKELDRQKDESFIYSDYVVEQMKAIGAQKLVYVNIVGCNATASKNDVGILNGYRGNVDASFTVVDMATAASSYSEKIDASRFASISSSNEKDAIIKAGKSLEGEAEEFIVKAFPLELSVLKILEEKKGKAEELLINGGDASGVKEGMTFELIEISQVSGASFEEIIGEVKVISVNGANFSKVKPKSGKDGKAILEAMNASGTKLILRSVENKSLFDKLGNLTNY